MIQLSLPTQSASGTISVPPLAVAGPGAGAGALPTVSFDDLLGAQSSTPTANIGLLTPITGNQAADFTNVYAAISGTTNALPVPVTASYVQLPAEQADQPVATDTRPSPGKDALPGGKFLPQPAAKPDDTGDTGDTGAELLTEQPSGEGPAPTPVAEPAAASMQVPLAHAPMLTPGTADTPASAGHANAATVQATRPDAVPATHPTSPTLPVPAEQKAAQSAPATVQQGRPTPAAQKPGETQPLRGAPVDVIPATSLPTDAVPLPSEMPQTAAARARPVAQAGSVPALPSAIPAQSVPPIALPKRVSADEAVRPDSAAAPAIELLATRLETPERGPNAYPTTNPVRLGVSTPAPVPTIPIVAPASGTQSTLPAPQATPVANTAPDAPNQTPVAAQSDPTAAPAATAVIANRPVSPPAAKASSNTAEAAAQPLARPVMARREGTAPAQVPATSAQTAAVPAPAPLPETGADLAASVGAAARTITASLEKPINAERPAASLALATPPAVTGGELTPAASAPLPGTLPTSTPTTATPQSATASAPLDVARIVETIARAREEAQPAAVEVSVRHAEFGPVSLRFEQDKGDLTVALRNADPDFFRAVSAATASDPSQARGDTRQDPSRQDQSRHDGARQDMSAGSQTGTGQGNAGQPRAGQNHRADQFSPPSAHLRTPSQGAASKAGDSRANGIFA